MRPTQAGKGHSERTVASSRLPLEETGSLGNGAGKPRWRLMDTDFDGLGPGLCILGQVHG